MPQHILDLDLGNSRLKWRYSDGRSQEEGVLTNSDLCTGLSLPAVSVERIRIATVAAQELCDLVLEACRQRWKVEPEVAVVQECRAGVKQGYRDSARLGVDRWLNILAAYARAQQACVVMSCGTAITVDLVSDNGTHLGGYIVPGLEMMRGALFSGTHAVKLDGLDPGDSLAPGRNTQQAVSRGLLLMVRGVIASSFASLSELGEAPLVVLTGGDGERLLPLVKDLASTNIQYLPNLVLDGLALALP